MRMFQKTDHMQNMCSQFPKKVVPIPANIVDTPLTSVDTMLQTQDKIMQNWSSSVDTSSGGVDTRDSSQNTFWPIWDSVSTLAHVVSTLEAFPEHLLGCFGTVCRH
ncbi:hypothetical protein Taro_002457 [Colocasia esculenta]|uniref:Uncharacterized protein n=1 Tax=Colocasia esculenta TaxID=4460 RepID=A0A843TKZ4_COLES|nr:hypothetical protein [Colocasia esculenta]